MQIYMLLWQPLRLIPRLLRSFPPLLWRTLAAQRATQLEKDPAMVMVRFDHFNLQYVVILQGIGFRVSNLSNHAGKPLEYMGYTFNMVFMALSRMTAKNRRTERHSDPKSRSIMNHASFFPMTTEQLSC